MMRKRLKYSWNVLKKAGSDFIDDDCLRSGAALSFYTLFSLAPIVLITIYIAGLFVDSTLIRDQITDRFHSLVGQQAAEGVFVLMETIRTEGSNVFSLIFGIILILFSATTIFVVIQTGFNTVYRVRPLPGKRGFVKLIRDRLISLGMILSLGFILLISLILDSFVMAFTSVFADRFKELSAILLEVLQNLLMLVMAYFVIFALFKFLPDARLHKRFIARGALFTTLLLLLGKFGIGWYISTSNLADLGGAAASIVLLMLWVYYSSVILFFGAELIRAQSIVSNKPYHADSYARKIKVVEIEDEHQ